jgi:hypothetical protein
VVLTLPATAQIAGAQSYVADRISTTVPNLAVPRPPIAALR